MLKAILFRPVYKGGRWSYRNHIVRTTSRKPKRADWLEAWQRAYPAGEGSSW